jgi:hypothetical protein
MFPVVCRLYRRTNVEDITPEWLENFSASTYYPMQGLLSDEDFTFLSQQPGFDLSLYRKLRRERLRIFRQYLNRLIVDFNRLHTTARLLLAHSPQDQSELMSRLIHIKVGFAVAVVRAELNYSACCLGYRSLAARAVIARLEEMNNQLVAISAAT